jgi:hypothetical protein
MIDSSVIPESCAFLAKFFSLRALRLCALLGLGEFGCGVSRAVPGGPPWQRMNSFDNFRKAAYIHIKYHS